MLHPSRKTQSGIALFCAAAFILTMLPGFASVSRAQNRRAYLEEFTGSWCGYCVRGAYAINNIDRNFPGKTAIVSYHIAQGAGEPDGMDTPQGDSLYQGSYYLGLYPCPPAGFPDGWTARMVEGQNWNVQPDAWADSVGALFGVQGYSYSTPGLVDAIITQPAVVRCKVDNVSFNQTTQMITARVTATFTQAMTGDFRLNLMVTEDSVKANQENYYSSGFLPGHNAPGNPYYNSPNVISNWNNMHVFREAVAGIMGQTGVIPASPAVGTPYSMTFTFPIPTNVLNPNHVHLVGIVNQYSATDLNGNEVYDAMDVPLTTTPIAYAPNSVSVYPTNGSLYTWAHAGGDTTVALTVENDGNVSSSISLAIDNPSGTLPSGWAVNFSPSTMTVAAGGSTSVTMTITAPEQSAYINPTVNIQPKIEGVYIPKGSISFTSLSDNTRYAAYSYGGENAAVYGMPDTMRLHTAYLPLQSNILSNYDPSDPSNSIRLAMFLSEDILDGGEGNGDPSVMPTILNVMSSGKRVYISSNSAIAFAFGGSSQATQTPEVQSFFTDSLGVNYTNYISRISNNQYVPFRIDGTSDPISAGMTNLSGNVQGVYSADDGTPVLSIPAGSPARSLFYVDNTPASIVSVKSELPSGNKVVYMGVTLNSFSDQTAADTIFRRSIEWLMAAPVKSNITANPSPVNLAAPAGQSASVTVTLTNSGSAPVTINTMTIAPSGTNFTFSGIALPATIAAGGTKTVTVTFAPSSNGPQTASLILGLPEGQGPIIPLNGTTQVNAVTTVAAPAVSLTASPNPFHGTTEVSYTAAPGEQNVTLEAYDLLGRQVANLPVTNVGNAYTAHLDGATLPDGTYEIVAHSSKGTKEIKIVNQQ